VLVNFIPARPAAVCLSGAAWVK